MNDMHLHFDIDIAIVIYMLKTSNPIISTYTWTSDIFTIEMSIIIFIKLRVTKLCMHVLLQHAQSMSIKRNHKQWNHRGWNLDLLHMYDYPLA